MIIIYEGKPGQGKTLNGVEMILDYLDKKDYYVASNIEINLDLLGEKRLPHFKQLSLENTIDDIMSMLNDLHELYEVKGYKNIIIVVDEVQTIMNSREWEKMDPKFQFFLQQHRHYKMDLIGLTQSIRRADVVMRELVQFFYRLHKIIVVNIPFLGLYGFFWRFEYDPDSIETSTRKYDNIDPFKVGRPIIITPYTFKLYDTYQKFPQKDEEGDIETVRFLKVPTIVMKRKVLDKTVEKSLPENKTT